MIRNMLKSITNLLINHAGKTFIGIMTLTLILGYQASLLQFKFSIDYLLGDNNPRIKKFTQLLDEFENDSNILLIAAGDEDSLRSFAYRIKPLLESFDKWVADVHTHIPIQFLRKNILKLMKSTELDNFGGIFYDPNLVPFLFNLNSAFEETYLHTENQIISHLDEKSVLDFMDRLQMFIRAQEEILLETEAVNVGQKAVDAIIFGEGLNFSVDRDKVLIIIEPGFNMHFPLEQLLNNVNGIDELITKIADQYGIRVGLAGPLIVARDHYIASQKGFWNLCILSLVTFSFILIIFFRMWSIPIIIIYNLIVGIVWMLGIYSFFMKDINLISILAIIISILLGIGNGIIFLVGYFKKRDEGLDIKISMQETLQCYLPCLTIGGVVVGLSFLALIFSEIKVCTDLGIMVGIGITITMLTAILILPTILVLREKLFSNVNPFHLLKNRVYLFFGMVGVWIGKYRIISIIFILFISGFVAYQVMEMKLETNLSDLYYYDSTSSNIEDELIESFGISSSVISLTIDSLKTARVMAEIAREKIYFGIVESISDYLPDEQFNDEKFRYLRELRREINSREVRKQLSSHDMNMYRKEIERLETNIIELQDLFLLKDQSKVYEKTKVLVGDGTDRSSIGLLSLYINKLDMNMNRLKLTYFQEQFSSAFKYTILEMANTEPLILRNLPMEIKSRFTVKNDNIFRLNIYPHKNIWDDTSLLVNFLHTSTVLNDNLTGWPVILLELKDRISYYALQSTQLFLSSLIILLLICLRSLKYALIIIVSIIIGFIWMFGLLMLFNISLNIINIWVMPIIISVGLNNVILLLQLRKQEKNLDTIYHTTEKTIFIATITILAMVLPFCFMHHTVLSSIARVLLLGLVSSFSANSIILPSLLGKNIST